MQAHNDLFVGKAEAVKLLGLSQRTLEADVANGAPIRTERIPPGPGKRFTEVLFHRGDLEKWKAERDQHKAVERPAKNAVVPAAAVDAQRQMLERFAAFLATCTARLEAPKEAPKQEGAALAELPDYAWLTVREASQLARMPVWWIRDQIRAGRLPAEPIGRSYRVRKADIASMPARTNGRARYA